jgi:hypothetical protein
MPSHLHENLIELFRNQPRLAADLLDGRPGVTLPPFEQATLSAGELNDVKPTEYAADLVVCLMNGDKAELAVIVEVQLSSQKRKRRSWIAYVGTLHARLGCLVVLLVICADAATANWCATPIHYGMPDNVLNAVVVGPRQIPTITDPVAAQQTPELTLLSTMAHGNDGPDQKLILEAFLSALQAIHPDDRARYHDVVTTTLNAAAREHLEALMTTAPYEYTSEFALRYFNDGEIKNAAKYVLKVLDARGVDLTPETRDRISQCRDVDQLDLWLTRAAVATTPEELFR